ncbi:MAG TPA: hypothetical protein VNJ53_13645 [Gaiellaceae bacterium]|nr:hypothetical protein [Gaiellaceae bacterium]
MPIPRKNERRDASFFVAAEEVGRLALAVGPLLERAVGVGWYERHGNEADAAALALCRLRRAAAGLRRGPEHGDAAVREALAGASPEALAWIASRAISYMDEHGFPEAVERYHE